MKIVYTSGFGSLKSSKKQAVKTWAASKSFEFHSFEYPTTYDPEIIIKKINEELNGTDEELIFVGCSLGGFWSLIFGEMYQRPCVVINPATRPSETLMKYLTATGRVKAFDGEQEYDLTEEIIMRYKPHEKYTNKYGKVAIINLDDEILNPNTAIEDLKGKGKIITFPNGGHSGSEYIGEIIQEIEQLMNRN